MLRGDHTYGPIDVLARQPFRKRTAATAVVRAGAFDSEEGQAEINRITEQIGQRRHDATQRAVSLVEQRADEFVLAQFANLTRDNPELTMSEIVKVRLERLFRRDDPAHMTAVGKMIDAHLLGTVPPDVKAGDLDDAGRAFWLQKHREVACVIENNLGPPGGIFVKAVYGTRAVPSPPRS